MQQVTFSGEVALENKKNVLFVTERAVFKLIDGGLLLTEYAPGIDIQKDIFEQMEFKPLIAEDLKEMDAAIFKDERMGLTF